MTPTIGRIVHYHPGPDDQFYGEGVVLVAIITQVKTDRLVNLMILAPNGQTVFGKSDILVLEGKSDYGGYACWPEIEPEPKSFVSIQDRLAKGELGTVERSVPRYPLDEPDDSAEEKRTIIRKKSRKK